MTATKQDAYISVWLDETSNEHGWVVDRCDKNGNSTTVRVFESQLEAEEFAAEYAAERGLPIR